MKKALPLVVMSVSLCSVALAQTNNSTPGGGSTYPGAEKPAVSFDSLDKNKDAKINKDEAKVSVTVVAAFDTADKNGDGALTKTEFDAYFSMR